MAIHRRQKEPKQKVETAEAYIVHRMELNFKNMRLGYAFVEC